MSVPRETFGRAPVRPADLTLFTPPHRTPAPVPTFEAVLRQERTLPLTPASARSLRFEAPSESGQRLVPVRLLDVPAEAQPKFEWVPAPRKRSSG